MANPRKRQRKRQIKLQINRSDIPYLEPEKALVQSRVSAHYLNILKKHNVDIPELLRRTVESAAKQILAKERNCENVWTADRRNIPA